MALELSFLPATQAILLFFPLTPVRFGLALTPLLGGTVQAALGSHSKAVWAHPGWSW